MPRQEPIPFNAGQIVLLAALAMLCFAANSLFCRLALAQDMIGPATFTAVRVLSASALLAAIVVLRSGRLPKLTHARFGSIIALFGYLVLFSFAYLKLSAATGALILFGAVQFVMFFSAILGGEKLSCSSWLAFAVAIGGLVYLVYPGITSPDYLGATLMAGSGLAWGMFSLFARRVVDPIESIAANFLACIPLVAIVVVFLSDFSRTTSTGLILAVASGAFASGFGYLIWGHLLRYLSATQAATVQLSVPAIAAFCGAAFLSEPITLRLGVASLVTLGGIAVVITQRAKK